MYYESLVTQILSGKDIAVASSAKPTAPSSSAPIVKVDASSESHACQPDAGTGLAAEYRATLSPFVADAEKAAADLNIASVIGMQADYIDALKG